MYSRSISCLEGARARARPTHNPPQQLQLLNSFDSPNTACETHSRTHDTMCLCCVALVKYINIHFSEHFQEFARFQKKKKWYSRAHARKAVQRHAHARILTKATQKSNNIQKHGGHVKDADLRGREEEDTHRLDSIESYDVCKPLHRDIHKFFYAKVCLPRIYNLGMLDEIHELQLTAKK